jgi:ketosteroid isomerase-like protein
MSHPNADLVRENFARFARGEGEAVYASWAEDAVWHVLDATRYQGNYTRDEYFTMLGTTWATDVQNYSPEIVSCESYGEDLVVAHLKSSGTHIDGPIDELGGLMIYRITDGKIVEGWALSRGKDATTPF